MRLATLGQPFDSPDWVFEVKWDGWRALAIVEGGRCSLVSRHRNVYKLFPELCSDLATLNINATLDGEVVELDSEGRPQFYELLRHRSRAVFVAFDITELDGRDLRDLPLIERKRILRKTLPSRGRVLVPNHVEGSGVRLFDEVCRRDLEGLVAKRRWGPIRRRGGTTSRPGVEAARPEPGSGGEAHVAEDQEPGLLASGRPGRVLVRRFVRAARPAESQMIPLRLTENSGNSGNISHAI